MSSSKENFLKTIYLYQNLESEDTRPGSIAKALGISNAAATDMAKKLSEKGLVKYIKYQPLSLSKEGEMLALKVIRKHRLWETFLHQTFDLSLLEIHKEAENLEHQTSDFLAETISKYLGHPTFDPHGDPIPAADGILCIDPENLVLFKGEVGSKYVISRLINKDEEFFQFYTGNGIEIGMELSILIQYSKNKLTEILINDSKILIARDFASHIYIKKIN